MNKIRLANLTSNILNPFLVSTSVVLLVAVQATNSLLDAVKWTLVPVVLGLLPVFLIIIYLLHRGSLENFFINARQQRTIIYLASAVCTAINALVLYRMGAPPEIIAVSVAAIAVILIFMVINLLWKISVHAALIAASVTVLIIVFGMAAALAAFLVPLTGWARIELKRHSPAQVVLGSVIAAVIAFIVFYSSGLV